MIKSNLVIRCWNCGNEETISQTHGDNVMDVNLDKLCPKCNSGWMIKRDLTFQKCLIPISTCELPKGTTVDASSDASEGLTSAVGNLKLF